MDGPALTGGPAPDAAVAPAAREIPVTRALEGADAAFLARRVRETGLLVHVVRDLERLRRMEELLRFLDAPAEVLTFPAWDCLPYDRVSPRGEIMAERIATLARLAAPAAGPRILLVAANALVQRVPPPEAVADARLVLRTGGRISREELAARLEAMGYRRVGAVAGPGDYAVRGGIVDVFPVAGTLPVRVDLFGESIESLRTFDPETQRSQGRIGEVTVTAVSEAPLTAGSIRRFRERYLQLFGAVTDDPLFEGLSAGRPQPGMEHWLPLFHERLVSLFDYLPEDAELVLDHEAEEIARARIEQVGEQYGARLSPPPAGALGESAPYRPVPPELLYLDEQELARRLRARPRLRLSPFAAPDGPDRAAAVELDARPARDFAPERQSRDGGLFDAVAAHVEALRRAGRRPVITAASEGAAARLAQLLADHGLAGIRTVERLSEVPEGGVGIAVLGLERGVDAPDLGLCLLTETDILGDRLARPRRARRRHAREAFLDLASLEPGDLVVHAEHGIGRFHGLVTLEVAGAPHDCLEIEYAGGDRLYVPVENLELVTRYGRGEEVPLDRLGGAAWQQRRAKVKRRIREMAGELVRIAAERRLKEAPRFSLPCGLYEEFAARFPFEETEDQARAIEAVLEDLASGRPMDRLVVGDVGFGKTEVAIRAAYVVAMCGAQVAVLCPTTLLAAQHARVFRERFSGLPVTVAELSRFTPAREAKRIREGLAAGTVDIVVGTHALLAEGVRFRNLGLLVIDEEQHFGVAHKEKLKKLRADVHVLTMTATPIPRTLHMALGGLRDLSVIATPPADRLAVRTFAMPADPVAIREAILREHWRGGQTYYVCPFVSDLERVAKTVRELVPEVKVAIAHGQMPARQLEAVMADFYARRVDVLVCTNIVESGLDVPTANTLIVHRADRFGLAQLYQLRGRIGRSRVRAYAYFTWSAGRDLPPAARRRLELLQSLEELGSGFRLAAYDLDIRGAGNLLGAEQSGHIREVGFELYNQMLEEAVAELRAELAGSAREEPFTPQISVDAAALLPEAYVPDLELRLQLYRRLAALETAEELDAFAAELVDRFGPMPEETRQLLDLVAVKQLCRTARIARLDVGPRGIVVAFHENRFPRPERLVQRIAASKGTMKVRPDHRLVVLVETKSPAERLQRARELAAELARLAA